MDAGMRVTVQLFARLRELAGRARMGVRRAGRRDDRRRLARRSTRGYPGARAVRPVACRAPVNAEFARMNAPRRTTATTSRFCRRSPAASRATDHDPAGSRKTEVGRRALRRADAPRERSGRPGRSADLPHAHQGTRRDQPLVERYRGVRQLAERAGRGARNGRRRRRGDAALAADEIERLEREIAALDERDQGAARARRIPTTTATSSSRSAPAPAATRRRCSPAICSACTRATPSGRAGRSTCCRSARPASAASRKSIATIEGKGVYRQLKHESGVHRVQRVPVDRSERPHPHVDGDRRRAAGSRGSRRPDRCQGPARRHVLLERTRRPERQHDLLGRAHHAPPDRRRGLAAGREVADQEPRRRR